MARRRPAPSSAGGDTRPLGTRGAYLTLGDEIFYAASAIDNLLEQGFTQNRIGGAVGMRIGSSARLELGYQWAYVDSGFVSRGDHLIQFNLIWDAR